MPLAERIHRSRTSINPFTYLATDFLNQFNEVAMSLDMLADWPDMFDHLRAWQPRSYIDHFRRSGFSDTDTIVDAYEVAPIVIRQCFDRETELLARLTAAGLKALGQAMEAGPMPGIYEAAAALSSDIRKHVAQLAAIINAGKAAPLRMDVMEQSPDSISGMNQSDIDALFD